MTKVATRVRWVTTNLDHKRIPLNATERGERQGNIPYWGANGVLDHVDEALINETVILIGEDGAPFLDQYKDVAFQSAGPIWPNNHIHILRPDRSKLCDGFLCYWLNTVPYAKYINGSTRDKLTQEQLGSIEIELPPLATQRRIARLLDEKTAKIDGLIEKKRALLDLLAEKRQALITRAVTKGLEPDAPMKPSGIDWLGDIPERWSLIPFKWQCQVQSGQVDPKEPEYAEMMLIAPDHIESGTGRLFGVASAEEQGAISGKYLCPEGSVLYSKIRPALRKVALYHTECICSADMYAIYPNRDLLREYLFYFILTDAFTSYAELESLRVAMPKVNRESLGAFPVPMPNIEEQREIVRFCEGVDQSYRKVADKLSDSVARLEEYRSAQITAAVTGQLAELR